jgi:2-methylcitrate dehydratase PrpD
VRTRDGRVLAGRVDEPKGDPGNTLDRDEITAKALRLAAFSGGAGEAEMRAAIDTLWRVAGAARVGPLLPSSSSLKGTA